MVNLFDRFVDFQNARFAILMISLEAKMITIENKKKGKGKKRIETFCAKGITFKQTFVIRHVLQLTDKKDVRKIRFSFIGTTGFNSIHFVVSRHVSNLFRVFSIFFLLIGHGLINYK